MSRNVWNDQTGYGAGIPAPPQSLPPEMGSPIFDIIRNSQNYQRGGTAVPTDPEERSRILVSLSEQYIPQGIAEQIADTYSGEWRSLDQYTKQWQPIGGKVQAEDGSWVPLSFYAQPPAGAGYSQELVRGGYTPRRSPQWQAPSVQRGGYPSADQGQGGIFDIIGAPQGTYPAGKSALGPSGMAQGGSAQSPIWQQKYTPPPSQVDHSYTYSGEPTAAPDHTYSYGGEPAPAVSAPSLPWDRPVAQGLSTSGPSILDRLQSMQGRAPQVPSYTPPAPSILDRLIGIQNQALASKPPPSQTSILDRLLQMQAATRGGRF